MSDVALGTPACEHVPMQSDVAEIVIVGGGIGGLALALALQGTGQSVKVCERASRLREVGAGILLTPNASSVLYRLGLLPEISSRSQVLRSWRILDSRGRVLQTFRVGKENAPSLSITRSALQRILQNHLRPESLRLDHEAVSIRGGSAGAPAEVQFSNGRTLSAKLVVGADGGRSVVRRQLFCEVPPQRHGYVGWRALVDTVPEAWKDGRVTESWAKGCRFGIAPVGADSCYWYATENAPADWTVPPGERKAYLLDKFRSWHDPICELIEATAEEDILFNDISDHPHPLARWHAGTVSLLGDAAHLMTPNLGQGAAMALEDAWSLACCLREKGIGEPALARYEQMRRRRAAFVLWLSRQIGRLIQIENPVAWRVRNVTLRALPDWLGTVGLRPVFGFRA